MQRGAKRRQAVPGVTPTSACLRTLLPCRAFQPVPTSQQLRWDSWARLTEPLLSTVPALHVGGNHEVERLPDGSTFTSFNARYPVPQVGLAGLLA